MTTPSTPSVPSVPSQDAFHLTALHTALAETAASAAVMQCYCAQVRVQPDLFPEGVAAVPTAQAAAREHARRWLERLGPAACATAVRAGSLANLCEALGDASLDQLLHLVNTPDGTGEFRELMAAFRAETEVAAKEAAGLASRTDSAADELEAELRRLTEAAEAVREAGTSRDKEGKEGTDARIAALADDLTRHSEAVRVGLTALVARRAFDDPGSLVIRLIPFASGNTSGNTWGNAPGNTSGTTPGNVPTDASRDASHAVSRDTSGSVSLAHAVLAPAHRHQEGAAAEVAGAVLNEQVLATIALHDQTWRELHALNPEFAVPHALDDTCRALVATGRDTSRALASLADAWHGAGAAFDALATAVGGVTDEPTARLLREQLAVARDDLHALGSLAARYVDHSILLVDAP
ncbi:hypothetical protein ABT160_45955 [Streptomyces sp. NPDC001941]|uniref:hypothetical protein n=1 Tax=Streptomyces sp. NPDC001941 TaxID=3154659 RepID=UPI00332EF684